MDAFKAQFERISQQLAALSATQKMLVAALVAVMVLTVLYWGKYAGNPEMVPVLDQTLSEDDIVPIHHQLELAEVPHTITGGKVLVPADRKGQILADLMFARVLPQDTHSAFETMSKEINPFESNTQVDMAFNEAKAMELSSVIGLFRGVASARVIINAKNDQRVEGTIPPSATVFITTRGEVENAKEMVRAAADGVAHAVSGLHPSEISVIINGVSMKVPAQGALGQVDDLSELREKREEALEQKIRNIFGYIHNFSVSVTCDVENRTTDEHITKYNKDGTVVQPAKTVSNTEEISTVSPPQREPGVTSNTNAGSNGPVSIDGSGGTSGAGGNTTNTQHDEVTNQVAVGSTVTNTETPAGKETAQTAAVRVPISYFTAIYKRLNPEAKDGEPPADFTTAQIASIREGVKKIANIKADEDVSVASYADLPMPDLVMAAAPSVQASTLNTVSGHAKEIGIAVLAIVSLLMMATMVRKSTPAPLMLASSGSGPSAVAASQIPGMNSLGTGESVAGEVGTGSGALDGMEMDEDAVRTQQMLDQVSTMVKENPDSAANLVKKWLSRT